MTTAKQAKDMADGLRKLGDAAGSQTAEGKRLLRSCRAWRRKQRELEQDEAKKALVG